MRVLVENTLPSCPVTWVYRREAASPRHSMPSMTSFDAPQEIGDDVTINVVLQHRILDAGLDVRVVVDFDDEHAAPVLPAVHPIQADAGQSRRLPGDLDPPPERKS